MIKKAGTIPAFVFIGVYIFRQPCKPRSQYCIALRTLRLQSWVISFHYCPQIKGLFLGRLHVK